MLVFCVRTRHIASTWHITRTQGASPCALCKSLTANARTCKCYIAPRAGPNSLSPFLSHYLFAGKCPKSNATLSSVGAFDRLTGSWLQCPPLLKPRVSARAVICGGELYVAGGWDGRAVLSSVERYDQAPFPPYPFTPPPHTPPPPLGQGPIRSRPPPIPTCPPPTPSPYFLIFDHVLSRSW